MKIGVPKEIKNHEYRVGLTPDSVRELVAHGHEVVVETEAGAGIGASDSDYEAAGASILADAAAVFSAATMIVKVKEPQAVERALLRPHHVLFTYLHLAPDPEQTHDLLKSGATCIAYETVTDARGGLPLLAPHVSGRPDDFRSRLARPRLKNPMAVPECCWAGSRAWLRQGSLSSAAGLSAPMRSRWRWALGRM